MADFALRLGNDMMIVEGAMGTMLMKAGADPDEGLELMNIIDPESVGDIHRLYRLAGADCAISNTFGGTRARLSYHGIEGQLEDINRAGVRIAKEQNPEHVLADMGPCGLMMGALGQSTFDEVYEQYREQAEALAKEEPDAFLIETMIDIADARAAIQAVRSISDLPIICTCSFGTQGTLMLSATTPEAAAVILTAAGADMVGLNCGLNSETLFPLAQRFARHTSLPLMVQPNAGLPKKDYAGNTYYEGTADEAARWSLEYRTLGYQAIGSCCGSTPSFTSALTGALEHLPVVPHTAEPGIFAANNLSVVKLESPEQVRNLEPFDLAEYTEEPLEELQNELLLGGNVTYLFCHANAFLLHQALRVYPGRAVVALDSSQDENAIGEVLEIVKKFGAIAFIMGDYKDKAAAMAGNLGFSPEHNLMIDE